MSKKIVAFHSYQLGERGSEVQMIKWARYNKEILGNESIIISTSSRPTPSLEMFEKEFKVILYPDVWVPDGKNNKLRSTLERICEENNITHFWAIKGGEDDGIMPKNVKTMAACIFRLDQPHGDVYTGICQYISDKYGSLYPWIYPIVLKEEPDYNEDFREELNIPSDAIVFGRHGGPDTFDLDFVKRSIIESISIRENIYFIFLNTDKFIEHPRVIHLGWTSSFKEKAKFVNTCDLMIHGRSGGEIFSSAIDEFSTRNKPVITWKPDNIPSGHDTGHLWVLGDNAFFYKGQEDLTKLLTGITKEDFVNKDWDVYKDTYSPENVMVEFNKIFLQD